MIIKFIVVGMHLLPYFNAAFNPIVYALCTTEFKLVLTSKWLPPLQQINGSIHQAVRRKSTAARFTIAH